MNLMDLLLDISSPKILNILERLFEPATSCVIDQYPSTVLARHR